MSRRLKASKSRSTRRRSSPDADSASVAMGAMARIAASLSNAAALKPCSAASNEAAAAEPGQRGLQLLDGERRARDPGQLLVQTALPEAPLRRRAVGDA